MIHPLLSYVIPKNTLKCTLRYQLAIFLLMPLRGLKKYVSTVTRYLLAWGWQTVYLYMVLRLCCASNTIFVSPCTSRYYVCWSGHTYKLAYTLHLAHPFPPFQILHEIGSGFAMCISVLLQQNLSLLLYYMVVARGLAAEALIWGCLPASPLHHNFLLVIWTYKHCVDSRRHTLL
jgi:hypothetical protein